MHILRLIVTSILGLVLIVIGARFVKESFKN